MLAQQHEVVEEGSEEGMIAVLTAKKVSLAEGGA
jgi:hypothetical protein